MKTTITFEGDSYEDSLDLKRLIYMQDICSCITNTRSMIYKRNKWEDISEEEHKFLLALLECLYIEGLELD